MVEQYEHIHSEIGQRGYVISEGAFSAEEVHAIRQELEALQHAEAFRKAGIGKEQDFQIDATERGDFIHWISAAEAAPATQRALQRIEEIQLVINRHLYLGIRDIECHYAYYPQGAGYKRHVDRHRHQSHRVISMVIYLNPDWQPGDGGELRLYPSDGSVIDIAPKAGTLALFLSELEHEVLPTLKPRYSITGWMLDEQRLF